MGNLTTETVNAVTRGVQGVIQTQFLQKGNYLQNLEIVLGRTKQLIKDLQPMTQLGNGTYRTTRDVVKAAAKAASQQFQLNDIKTKLKDTFIDLRRDHSSIEDDEFRKKLQESFGELSQEVIKMFEQYYKHYIEVYNKNTQIYNTVTASKQAQEAADIMKQGYQILSSIGEMVRGEKILYEVQISVGTKNSQKTAFLTLEQIMQYTNATYYNGEMRLKLNTAAINKAAQAGEIQLFEWSDEYRTQYQNYTTRVIHNELNEATRNWSSNIGVNNESDIYINRGNVTESFRAAATRIMDRYVEDVFGQNLMELNNSSDYQIHTMLHSTLQNTTAYWQGPDFVADINALFAGLTGDISEMKALAQFMGNNGTIGVQEKVNNATFTNLTSLARELERASKSLQVLAQPGAIQSIVKSQITDVDKEVEQAALDFVRQFIGGS